MHRAGRAVEVRVAEAEHAAVAGDEPVALAARCGRHPDDRLVEMYAPSDPKNGALKLKTPPSLATSQ